MSEQRTENLGIPMLCQSCGWRGTAGELVVKTNEMHCPKCDSDQIAQVLGAPLHESDDK